MKKLFGCAAATALMLWAASPMFAAEEKTLTGQVVDVVCTLKDKANAGEDHADCATSCAKRGQPVGIIVDDAIYTITGEYAKNNNEKLIEFIAKKVQVTGTVTDNEGQKTIDVTAITLVKGM